jgi:Putative peptidoglycan binding domain
MRASLLIPGSLSLTLAACSNFLLPAGTVSLPTGSTFAPAVAAANECFVNVAVPAVQETVSERVLIRAATTRTEVTAARHEPGSERVLVKPASTRVEVVPATFETVMERVLLTPASKQIEAIPATFETITERLVIRPESRRVDEVAEVLTTAVERVLVTPATTISKRCSELTTREWVSPGVSANTKDDLCSVAVPAEYRDMAHSIVKTPATAREIVTPAQYKIVLKTVELEPARTREIDVPAQYAEVARVVVKTPSATREIEEPAEYQTVITQRLITPSITRVIETPAEYNTISRTVVTSPASTERRQVVCEVRLTPAWLGAVQTALTRAGFNTGRVDGIVDTATLAALSGFQRARKLPLDDAGYLNVATVRALGLSER